MILDKAPPAAVIGGHAALTKTIDDLLDAREKIASDRSANAENLFYGYPKPRALLHDPLDPLLDTLDPLLRRFRAGHSMRDVEHSALVKVTDPYGNVLS